MPLSAFRPRRCWTSSCPPLITSPPGVPVGRGHIQGLQVPGHPKVSAGYHGDGMSGLHGDRTFRVPEQMTVTGRGAERPGNQTVWAYQSSKQAGKETAREAARGEAAGVTGWEGAGPRGLGRFQDNREPSSSKREKSGSSCAALLWWGGRSAAPLKLPACPGDPTGLPR